jgi:hypothetical protein
MGRRFHLALGVTDLAASIADDREREVIAAGVTSRRQR